jgi:hypothetical protein
VHSGAGPHAHCSRAHHVAHTLRPQRTSRRRRRRKGGRALTLPSQWREGNGKAADGEERQQRAPREGSRTVLLWWFVRTKGERGHHRPAEGEEGVREGRTGAERLEMMADKGSTGWSSPCVMRTGFRRLLTAGK